MNIKKIVIIYLGVVLLTACSGNENETQHEEHGSDGHESTVNKKHGGDKHEEEAGVIKLTFEQMKTASIEVSQLELQSVNERISAPGEVKLNDYQTVKITPRIDAQIIDRHATLGQQVIKGEPLITLSSVDMAEVQAKLSLATREWYRVKKLGRKVISEKRYIEAKADWSQLLTKARSYGMTEMEIQTLMKDSTNSLANGTFQLLAPMSGRIIHDDFIIGERIEPGRVLITITDESVMWVEARLNPGLAAFVSVGNEAEIEIGSIKLPAKVSQIHHALDEATRTLAVRLEVDNLNDQLHPGIFVTANIASTKKMQALVVPEAAVLRSADGDWEVLIQHEKTADEIEFKAQEIDLIKIINGKALIKGIKPGTFVVTNGAFFVQSEIAKGGFEIHNH